MGKGSRWWTREGRSPAQGRGRSHVISAAALLSALLVAALATVASAHAQGSASPAAWDRLLVIVLVMGAIVAGVVFSVIGVALWRYRESSPYVRKEPKTHDTRLETVWTIIPVILVTAIIILSLQVMSSTQDLPEGGLDIDVIGKQFEWVFVYPDNTTSVNELWVEEGQTVIFHTRSEDVIHSFFIPEFKLKVDAFPNYVDDAYIVAEPAGDYDIYCAEYCGDIHSEMLATLHIFPKGLSDVPYGPPPGEVPPPPEVETVKLDVELREDGGPNAAVPWSMEPALITIPADAQVNLRFWNNGTETHGVTLAPPYNYTIAEIPAGGSAYMNFTASMPTRGTVLYCPDDDHAAMGLMATVVVNATVQQEVTLPEGISLPSPWYFFAGALLLLGAMMYFAAYRPPKEDEVEEDGAAEAVGSRGKADTGGEEATKEGEGGPVLDEKAAEMKGGTVGPEGEEDVP